MKDGTKFNFTILGSIGSYGSNCLQNYVKDIKPDYMGILLDTFMLMQNGPWFIDSNFTPAKTYFYFPSDGGGALPLGCEAVLKKVHYPIAMSKFAQKQLKDIHGMDSTYIPHGVDTELFSPMSIEERTALRQRWGLDGKFVVGVVARNQPRKSLDRTIKAFSIFAKKHPEAVLFMHLDPNDAAASFNISALIARYNLHNRVRFTGMLFWKSWLYKDMRDVYNLMDVFLLTTTGEGFGVPIIEAMSTEVPVIATDYTTTPELIIHDGQCGEGVKLLGTEDISFSEMLKEKDMKEIDVAIANGTMTGSWTVERGLMDVNDCAKKLEKLYNDPELRAKYGKVGREKAIRDYSWDKLIPMWEDFFKKNNG